MGSDIERQLLAETLPVKKRKWKWGVLVALALLPFVFIMYYFFDAMRTAFFSSPHRVTLVAFGACPKAKVLVRMPGAASGWEEKTLPTSTTRTLDASQKAQISVTGPGDCRVGCRIEIDGKTRLSCKSNLVTCDFPIAPPKYQYSGCDVTGP